MAAKSKRSVEIAERRQQVAANIRAGTDYRTIAEALHVSVGTIASDFKAIMKDWRAHAVVAVEDVVFLELERLNTLQNAIWAKAVGGDYKAIELCLKISERRVKMLGVEMTGSLSELLELLKLNDQELYSVAKANLGGNHPAVESLGQRLDGQVAVGNVGPAPVH